MGNIIKTRTDMCMMDYCPDAAYMRSNYGAEAADNYIIWNFRQRLGDNVDILSVCPLYIVSWEEIDYGIKIPKRIMYLCTYIPCDEEYGDEEYED